MSSPDNNDPPAAAPGGEPLLQRWSRLKSRAREAERQGVPTSSDPGPNPVPAPHTVTPLEPAAAGQPPRIELPDLDLLGQDSDYSAFLAPGVEPALRKRALRQLFASPKFNVFDGLDTYRDDFTSFPALGNIVTADMRHHVERLAKDALAKLEQDTAAVPGTVASEAGTPALEPASAGATPNSIAADAGMIDEVSGSIDADPAAGRDSDPGLIVADPAAVGPASADLAADITTIERPQAAPVTAATSTTGVAPALSVASPTEKV
jgi:hypothetical protein